MLNSSCYLFTRGALSAAWRATALGPENQQAKMRMAAKRPQDMPGQQASPDTSHSCAACIAIDTLSVSAQLGYAANRALPGEQAARGANALQGEGHPRRPLQAPPPWTRPAFQGVAYLLASASQPGSRCTEGIMGCVAGVCAAFRPA